MFACRLSEQENQYFESLLDVASSYGQSKSDQFRAIIEELSGRLSRNFLGHLVYKAPSYEVSERLDETQEIDYEFPDLAKMKVKR